MKKLSLHEMEVIEGGGSCAWGIVGTVLGGASVIVATGGWALLAAGFYIYQVKSTAETCFS